MFVLLALLVDTLNAREKYSQLIIQYSYQCGYKFNNYRDKATYLFVSTMGNTTATNSDATNSDIEQQKQSIPPHEKFQEKNEKTTDILF